MDFQWRDEEELESEIHLGDQAITNKGWRINTPEGSVVQSIGDNDTGRTQNSDSLGEVEAGQSNRLWQAGAYEAEWQAY